MRTGTVLSAGLEIQRVAIQGIRGAFHEIAARKFFGPNIQLSTCDTFPELFRSLDKRESQIGVMAIENSVAGSILPNYALLRESPYTIIGEVYLRIQHNLMVLGDQKIETLKEVHSHPMALHQCQKFFSQYPNIKLVESRDTAASAKWLKEEQITGIGAIASGLAAEIYGLEVLAEGIETNPRNFTRFLVLVESDKARSFLTRVDKASICFNLSHMSQKVGSLAGILAILGQYGLNLSKIQSLPILGKEWQYFFHVDLEFDDYHNYQLALDAIRPLISDLKILGEYPRADKADVHLFSTEKS